MLELLIVYNNVRNGSLWRNVVFEKEVIPHSLMEEFFCNFDDQLSRNFHRFYACYDGIHQVRTLVFDNYQTCPVPLKQATYHSEIVLFATFGINK